ncbi:uncharacterized protein BO80DRAFT_40053 [Aspergillus ibericus CBS 121593]|uniref:Uncharacterized protein n=1 Tax=Aspergillus ibericus CBS 121593 TaxID=1448316 RepID=A0A395H5D9_9EURO|nr:hypothetical protein BO80DRAFT_40053 [Aspergillus ibericus CBS 121593]RAL02118.1 hypothetical protein BO80DRAFT_40053 [Aspergillus ibericus CBS 121593]
MDNFISLFTFCYCFHLCPGNFSVLFPIHLMCYLSAAADCITIIITPLVVFLLFLSSGISMGSIIPLSILLIDFFRGCFFFFSLFYYLIYLPAYLFACFICYIPKSRWPD